MGKNIILDNEVFTGVESVVLPQQGGGSATFIDSSGGASALTALETKTAQSGDTYLQFDWQSEWNNYAAYVLAVENLEQTPSAFMRLGINSTSTSSGNGFYINGATKFTTKADFRLSIPIITINGAVYYTDDSAASTKQIGSALDMTSGYIRITPVSAQFVSGKFTLYGLK